jgi:2Fe-2S ferredoxin
MPSVTFLPDGKTVEVEPGTTLLDAAKRAGARVGDACGGNCACSTCHVYVRRGLEALSEPEDPEADILDKAFAVLSCSRLSCQSRVGTSDVVVEVTAESRQAWLNEHPDARGEGTS